MWLLTQSAFTLLCALVALPWVPVILGRRVSLVEWASISFAAGYALLIPCGLIVAMTGSGTAGWGFLGGVAALGGVFRWRAELPATREDPFLPAGVALWAAVAVSLLPRVHFQLRFGEWPRGWDSSFHLTLVRAIELQGGIPWTLAPFETAAVNYPWGSHLAVLAQSVLTSSPAHLAFAAQNCVTGCVLSMLAVALLAWSSTRSNTAAILGALIYANVMHFGGLDYQNWGGLPNHVGMALFIAGFALNAHAEDGRTRWTGTVLLAAAWMVHHHVMITGIGVMGFLALARCVEERSAAPLKRVFVDVSASLVLAAPVALVLLSRVGQVGEGRMLAFKENFDWLNAWRDSPGVVGLVLGALGLAAIARRPGRRRHLPEVAFLAALAVMFMLFSAIWKIVTHFQSGVAHVAMTPSRFLTDLAYPLAACAAVFLQETLGTQRKLLAAAVLGLPLVLAEPWMWMKERSHEVPPSSRNIADALELQKQLPADALVAARFNGDLFCTYLLARECTDTPRPVSEPPNTRLERKKAFGAQVLKGRVDPAARTELLGTRPLWIVSDQALPAGVTPTLRQGALMAGAVP